MNTNKEAAELGSTGGRMDVNSQNLSSFELDSTGTADRVQLCSGYGQWHSTNNKTNPKAYIGTTLLEIEAMAAMPSSVDKENAQWAIFSTLKSRVHAEQRERGEFYALWADIDETDGLTFADMVSRAGEFIPGDFIAYTSRGATEERQKARLIVPLREPISGATYIKLATIINDKLEAAGITPDRATQRPGQLCYLPNSGEFYQHQLENVLGAMSADDWRAELEEIEARETVKREGERQQREQARVRASERMASGCKSPIEAFNAEFDIPLMLSTFGYMKAGDRWISPNSSSQTAGVSLTTDGRKWLSTHQSDGNIGMPTDNGTMGDAFDLFAYYAHGGNRDAALKEAGAMFTTAEGVTITKANQREYMEAQAREGVLIDFPDAIKPQPKRSGFRLTTVSELLREPEPLVWLIRDYLLPEGLSFVNGAPATGKSLIAIDWACCIATGTDWHGRRVQQGGVVILAGEGQHGIKRRLKAWAIHNDTELAQAPLAVSDRGASLTEPASLLEVKEAVDDFAMQHGQPKLIVIDTLHRNLGGADENSAQDMAVYFNHLDELRERYKCQIVTVHHSGHMDTKRARGSSAIKAAVDTEYLVTNKSGAIILTNTKMKDADTPEPACFTLAKVTLEWLDGDGLPESSVTITQSDMVNTKAHKSMTPSILYAINTLHEALGDNDEVHLDEWRELYYQGHTADTQEAKRQAFNRARKTLIESRVATVKDDIYQLSDGDGAPWHDCAAHISTLRLAKSMGLDHEGGADQDSSRSDEGA